MKRVVLILPALMTSCGTLPEPFYGDPGSAGAKLGTPAAAVLFVPAPGGAMLGDAAGLYAKDLAAALASDDVPTMAGDGGPQAWRVTTTASVTDGKVTPSYGIVGPGGKIYGAQAGTPVDGAVWASGDPAALNAQAEADAVLLSRKLAAINASVQGANPNSLENRTPRVFFGSVTGAPGDGDNALALNMTRDLPSPATKLVHNAAAADFTVDGRVKTTPDKNHELLLEIDWIVHDSSRREVGQVTQLHELNATDIEPYWGDVAAAAASEGAAGVNEVIGNATLHKAAATHDAALSDTDYGGALAIPPEFLLPAPGAPAEQFAEGGPAPALPAPAAAPVMLAEATPPARPNFQQLQVSMPIVPVTEAPLQVPAVPVIQAEAAPPAEPSRPQLELSALVVPVTALPLPAPAVEISEIAALPKPLAQVVLADLTPPAETAPAQPRVSVRTVPVTAVPLLAPAVEISEIAAPPKPLAPVILADLTPPAETAPAQPRVSVRTVPVTAVPLLAPAVEISEIAAPPKPLAPVILADLTPPAETAPAQLRVSVRTVPVTAVPLLAPLRAPVPFARLSEKRAQPKAVMVASATAHRLTPMPMVASASPAPAASRHVVATLPMLTVISTPVSPAAFVIRPIPLAHVQELASITKLGGWSPTPMTLHAAFSVPARAKEHPHIQVSRRAAPPQVAAVKPAVIVETGAMIETAGDALER